MKKVVGYVRVSTDGQVGDDKWGLDEQKERILQYCSQNDMKVVDWYEDKGESGVKESRPALDRLLYGELSNPPIEAVIVAKSDRIARDIKLYFYYLMLLSKRKIELISATEKTIDDGSGLGNIYLALMLFVAEQERLNITKRTSGGRNQKAKTGGYAGGRAPIGYMTQNAQLVPNPAEVPLVRRVYELYSQGFGTVEISRRMEEEGYTTRSGSGLTPSTVQSILSNQRMYEGMYRYGKTRGNMTWVKGQHEPILKEGEFGGYNKYAGSY